MAKLPITVCIIAKDEERYIEECLKHLRKYNWEIIVADTGSEDRTKEIAEKYADKVVDFEWIDDFAAARNYCASFAKNNWILAIDCDEYVNSVNVSELRILMQRYPRYTGVIRLKNLVPEGDDGKGYVSDDVPRMYNKNFYHYDLPIHEQIRPIRPKTKEEEDSLEAFLLPMEVIHHGYALTGEEMERKQRRNLQLLHKAIESQQATGYHYFQIGQSHFVLGEMDEAIEAYEKGMTMIESTEYVYVPEMIISLGKAYCNKGRLDDAIELMEKYNSVYDTAKYNFAYAELLRENDRVLKALMLYIKVTTMQDVETLGDNLIVCYAHIIELYRAMGNEEMANLFMDRFQQCVDEKERIVNS